VEDALQDALSEETMIDKDLLAILACPDNHQPLREAEAAQIDELNRRISAGECKNVGGTLVEEALNAGLVRQDDKILYPIRDEIPVLLVDEGIPL
jgi:uncharacterized protein YbaR (Trm112 family)